MNRRILATIGVLAAAFSAGRMSLAGGPAEETVAAKRYRIKWSESTCDMIHGGSEWIQEIYLPGAKVAAGLTFEYGPEGTAQALRRPRLYALPADGPRNDLTGLHGPKPSTVEDVRIPADLAKEIVELSALSKRQREECLRVGKAVAERLDMKPVNQGE